MELLIFATTTTTITKKEEEENPIKIFALHSVRQCQEIKIKRQQQQQID